MPNKPETIASVEKEAREVTIEGYEVLEKEPTYHPSGVSRVYLPEEWADETVKIVRVTDSENGADV